MRPSDPGFVFARLRDLSLDALLAHMADPRLPEHMPLLKGVWDRRACEAFVAAKEERWRRDGLGHWAIHRDGAYVGWGGFEKEGEEWDYGLVLRPEMFGLGAAITRQALAFARADPRISVVTFLLPPSRTRLRGLDRLGARYVGDVEHQGHRFQKFRLETGDPEKPLNRSRPPD